MNLRADIEHIPSAKEVKKRKRDCARLRRETYFSENSGNQTPALMRTMYGTRQNSRQMVLRESFGVKVATMPALLCEILEKWGISSADEKIVTCLYIFNRNDGSAD